VGALARPVHPTWMADRLAAAGSRVYHQYGLDLEFTWPRLWLLLPELTRTEVRDTRDSFAAAATRDLAAALGFSPPPVGPIARISGTASEVSGTLLSEMIRKGPPTGCR
jgi:hypothetical protein